MRKKILFVALCWAVIMVWCSQVEYEELAEYPVAASLMMYNKNNEEK